MSGALWALAAGVGFGLFQTVNRRAVQGMDVFVATFLQLAVSALVLTAVALLTVDLSPLLTTPRAAFLNFAAAGFFHFFIGWTFLNASQKRIGSARTSPLIGTTPLFAAVLAAVFLGELPTPFALLGIALIVLGVYVISRRTGGEAANGGGSGNAVSGLRAAWLGLSAALCWSISPIFIRSGLRDLPSPLLGVTLGIAASAAAYGVILVFQRERWSSLQITGEALPLKIVAGVLVGLSTWARYVALDLAPVAVVLAITMVSTPVVILLSPLVSGRDLERVTAALWLGAGSILAGALLLTLIP